jgi:putative aldouronate transport system substrate-binding protein
MYTVIPKTSKYAADVMKYFNAKLEENTYRELALGKENVDYTVKDGAYYPILPAFFDDRGNSNFFMNGCSKNDVTYWLCRVRKDNNLYDAYSQLNYAKDSAVVVDPVNDVPLSIYSEIADSQAALNDIANQFLIKSVTGNYSDAVYSDFVANWKSQGGDALVKTINDWYASK